MGDGRGSRSRVCESRQEAGPLRRDGLAERDREVRVVLEGFVEGVLLSVRMVSECGEEVSLIGRRLGVNFGCCRRR